MSNLNPENKWKPGQSGNPKGRPKKYFNPTAELKLQLGNVDATDPQGRTYGQIMIARLIKAAVGYENSPPSIRAQGEIWDRLCGKPPQAIAIADLRTETREQLIANILESARAMRDDENPTIQ
jgi:hypothetical protein